MQSPPGAPGFASVASVDVAHPDRGAVEAFIAEVYKRRYGARLSAFLPRLLACRNADGHIVAAVGWRDGSEGALFLEQYLDLPAEQLLAARTGVAIARRTLAEVGNLAALDAGASRALIAHATRVLHAHGTRWVVFTATRQLRNAFHRLRLVPTELAPARPERLQGAAAEWGNYYRAHPHVVYGDVAAAHAFLVRYDPARTSAEAHVSLGLCMQGLA